jgi:hypothetical protein
MTTSTEPRWLSILRDGPLGEWSINAMIEHQPGELARLMAEHAQALGIVGPDPTPAEVVQLCLADARARGVRVTPTADGRWNIPGGAR